MDSITNLEYQCPHLNIMFQIHVVVDMFEKAQFMYAR